jgi:hypothetical protein
MCSTYYMSILTGWFHTFNIVFCHTVLCGAVLILYCGAILHCGVALYCIVSFCILLCCGAFCVSHTILELECFALQYCTYCFIMYSATAQERQVWQSSCTLQYTITQHSMACHALVLYGSHRRHHNTEENKMACTIQYRAK